MNERAKFEVYYTEYTKDAQWHFHFDLNAVGKYFNPDLENLWIGWQACAESKKAEIAGIEREMLVISVYAEKEIAELKEVIKKFYDAQLGKAK